MTTEDCTITLNAFEVELLLAALFHYEMKSRGERSTTLSEQMLLLRRKLIEAS